MVYFSGFWILKLILRHCNWAFWGSWKVNLTEVVWFIAMRSFNWIYFRKINLSSRSARKKDDIIEYIQGRELSGLNWDELKVRELKLRIWSWLYFSLFWMQSTVQHANYQHATNAWMQIECLSMFVLLVDVSGKILYTP